MRALSIRMPWAWAILHAGKRIENRVRRDGGEPVQLTRFRGEFLIHASKGCTKREFEEAAEAIEDASNPSVVVPPLAELQLGGIVGAARVVGCIGPDVVFPAPAPEHGIDLDGMRWKCAGQYGLVLADVRPSPRFVPCSGMLGFWEVPADVVAALRGAA